MDVLESIRMAGHWYIAVVIISVIFLIMALKFPTTVIDNTKVLKSSIIGLLYGVLAWMLDDLIIKKRSYKTANWSLLEIIEENYYNTQITLLAIFFFICLIFVLL